MKACFVGLGYIGLPTAIIAATEGNVDVIGVDIDPEVVEMIVTPNAVSNKSFAVGIFSLA